MSVKNYPDTPRVYLDMDGVLADFAAACDALGENPHKAKLRVGLYVDLPLIAGAREGVLALIEQGWFIFVLTKIPDKNPHAATEKILWLRKHFPELGERIILSPDKGAVGTSQDFLVDDFPQWANAHKFPGTVMHFGPDGAYRDWNVLVEKLAELAPRQ